MKRVFNLIVMDESGSMAVIKEQALMGLNETIATIKKMQKQHPDMEQRVSLVAFDSNHQRMIFDNLPSGKTHILTSHDYRPGGATPLYDAIGTSIARLQAQSGLDDHVLVTIITDGEENCSQEYNLRMIKTLIEKMKQQKWTFTFIGTDNLDVEGMAMAMNIDNHLSFCEDAEGTTQMFRRERRARERYYALASSNAPMPDGAYFDE